MGKVESNSKPPAVRGSVDRVRKAMNVVRNKR